MAKNFINKFGAVIFCIAVFFSSYYNIVTLFYSNLEFETFFSENISVGLTCLNIIIILLHLYYPKNKFKIGITILSITLAMFQIKATLAVNILLSLFLLLIVHQKFVRLKIIILLGAISLFIFYYFDFFDYLNRLRIGINPFHLKYAYLKYVPDRIDYSFNSSFIYYAFKSIMIFVLNNFSIHILGGVLFLYYIFKFNAINLINKFFSLLILAGLVSSNLISGAGFRFFTTTNYIFLLFFIKIYLYFTQNFFKRKYNILFCLIIIVIFTGNFKKIKDNYLNYLPLKEYLNSKNIVDIETTELLLHLDRKEDTLSALLIPNAGTDITKLGSTFSAVGNKRAYLDDGYTVGLYRSRSALSIYVKEMNNYYNSDINSNESREFIRKHKIGLVVLPSEINVESNDFYKKTFNNSKWQLLQVIDFY